MKPIRLLLHASSYAAKRGFTVAEVEETIQSSKIFPFGREWNKRIYANKEVRSIFAEEEDEIMVVTSILTTPDEGYP